jgi:hypothetical protein
VIWCGAEMDGSDFPSPGLQREIIQLTSKVTAKIKRKNRHKMLST